MKPLSVRGTFWVLFMIGYIAGIAIGLHIFGVY